MKPTISLRKALADKQLLGNALPGDTWASWRTLLIAAMGEALTDDERATFRALTGREHEPRQRVDELVAVIGRRGGKSKAVSALAAYLATLCEHPLVRGERGVVLCIAPDQRQAKIILEYAEAALAESPILQQLIANRTADTLELTNRINIEVRAASFRRLRGPTYIAVIADEAAYWISDEWSSNPDVEIVNAVKPGLLTTGGPLIVASSPYARKGVLWDAFRKHYGAKGDPRILVARGTSRDLNPSLPQAAIAREFEKDPIRAAAEFGANFRDDISAFIDREMVMACVDAGIHERVPMPGVTYYGFVDPSGGVHDAMTCSVSHVDDAGIVIVDAVREIAAPFDPDRATDEFAQLFKRYRINRVYGDKYAAEWTAQAFEKRGIRYWHSELPRSGLYLNLLPHLTTKTVRLLDNPRGVNQIANLERRTHRGGKDSIDHPDGAHDDIANAIAGVVYVAALGCKPSGAGSGSYTWGIPGPATRFTHADPGFPEWDDPDHPRFKVKAKIPPNVVPGTTPCLINFRELEAKRALGEGLSRKILKPRVW